MTCRLTVPVEITAQAAARVAELGMQAAMERMLEHACGVIAGLQRLEVLLVPPYDTGDEPMIVIEATRPASIYRVQDPIRSQWRAWELETFSPDIFRHFALQLVYEKNHGG